MVVINGQINLVNGQPVLQMSSVFGASSGASINSSKFGFHSNAAYKTTVILYQLQ